jgi:hypothetical protein
MVVAQDVYNRSAATIRAAFNLLVIVGYSLNLFMKICKQAK